MQIIFRKGKELHDFDEFFINQSDIKIGSAP